jgi:PEGA domain
MKAVSRPPTRWVLRGIGGVLIPGLVLCGALLYSRAMPQKSRGPLSKDEIIDLLKSGVTPARVAGLVREFGVSFQLSPAIENELKSTGATDELFQALRDSAPKTPAPVSTPAVAGPLLIKSTPAGAQVFLDGKPVGRTNAEGQLELLQRPLGEHKIRLTLSGYEDYEQTTGLLAGQLTSITATLKPVPPPAPLPTVAKFRVTLELKAGHRPGELIISNGMLRFNADHDNSDSFESPLREITYGTAAKRSLLAPQGRLEGFYLRPGDGKDRIFHSDSTLAILQLLQQLGSHR